MTRRRRNNPGAGVPKEHPDHRLPCGKVIYPTAHAAYAAAERFHSKKKARAYRCEKCGEFHLTSHTDLRGEKNTR